MSETAKDCYVWLKDLKFKNMFLLPPLSIYFKHQTVWDGQRLLCVTLRYLNIVTLNTYFSQPPSSLHTSNIILSEKAKDYYLWLYDI